MTRRLGDACNPANLPPGLDLYGTYVDGSCFVADGTAVRISSLGTNAGNTGDCEPGNPFWPIWIRWVEQRRAAGVTPTIYCMDDGYGGSFWNGWRHADGVAAFQQAGVPEPQWWVSHPGATSIPSYAVAVQVEVNVQPGYDLSLALDHVPGWDSDPPIQEIPDMFFMQYTGLPLQLVCSCPAVGLTAFPQVSSSNGVPVLTMGNAEDYQAVLAESRKMIPDPTAVTGSGQITGSFTIG